jgi:predicted alpha/beta-fold hydrolase
MVRFERETLTTPDGDELIVDHVNTPGASARVLMLHGLEGSSNSVYVQGMTMLAARRGLAVSCMNFRGCAREPGSLSRMIPNHRPRMYHSGETSDFAFFAGVMAEREPDVRLFATGVSLGGNVLLKWLGDNPGQTILSGAVALSVPYDLKAGATYLEKGLGRVYAASFVRTLTVKAERVARLFPEAAERVNIAGLRGAATFREIDDYATAPLHGFRDAEDYWYRCSSLRVLDRIRTPTLCVSALDDPFLPPSVLDDVSDSRSDSVELIRTTNGGHIGFVGDSLIRPRYWAEETAIDWISSALS